MIMKWTCGPCKWVKMNEIIQEMERNYSEYVHQTPKIWMKIEHWTEIVHLNEPHSKSIYVQS